MTDVDRHLHLVRSGPVDHDATAELDDLGLTILIFLVAALPLVSSVAGLGQWSDGSLGLGAVGVLLAGRELAAWLLARLRHRRRS